MLSKTSAFTRADQTGFSAPTPGCVCNRCASAIQASAVAEKSSRSAKGRAATTVPPPSPTEGLRESSELLGGCLSGSFVTPGEILPPQSAFDAPRLTVGSELRVR